MGEQRREPAAHVHRVGYANRAIKKKRCKRTRRGASTVSMALQDLFVSCKQVFKGPDSAPLPQDIKRLCNLLDNMKPEDVGLSSELQFFKTKDAVKETPRVTYTTIYKCDDFSLCIFFLPATAVIPLHNHPGMTVFSKLLLGTMHIKSYDWIDPPRTDGPDTPTQLRLAKLEADNGEMEVKREEGKRYAWLEETEVPENSKMDGIEYLGPQGLQVARTATGLWKF
ncbi:hypothetical protein OIU84_027531 [Salix udensis]|uniref:cysteine dioxygenase n=1 Tax=Salix udensis TaxID=889485 RepID=A0AAD6KH50_9ROSI|nr:hypothetical protein OIU84_027531 [Salix udensis]